MNKKLLQWIETNILDKNGNPQGRSFNLRKKNNIKECNDILEITSFLGNDCSLSERVYCIFNNIKEKVSCKNENCNNLVIFHGYKYGYSKYCSPKCSSNSDEIKSKICITNLEKYGVENTFDSAIFKEKRRQTNLEKYGVDNPFQSEIIKEKIRQKNISKIGYEYPMQSEKVRVKSKKTLLNKFGVDHNSRLIFVREKRKKTNIERYGTENPNQLDFFKEKTRQTNLKKYGIEHSNQRHISKKSLEFLNNKQWLKNQHHDLKLSCVQIGKLLDVYYGTVISYLKKHNIELRNYFTSMAEEQLESFININIERNIKGIIHPYELDIYIPEYKLAIEFDGLYWHSRHHRDYHLKKTHLCQKKGIQLLHIFENEWSDLSKQNIWKSIINSKLGRNDRIFARKCEIREIINNKIVEKFLDNNHLQGHCQSSVKLGLFYKDEIVSLMTFGKTRFSRKYEWEMIRFCNKKFTNVIGGASKLYKYFISNYKPSSVISYADRRYSNGDLYRNLGFEFSHYSKPNYWYFKNNQKLYSRVKFQKHKLKDLLEHYDSSKSEIENMLDNGYQRIFDCGNIIFYFS